MTSRRSNLKEIMLKIRRESSEIPEEDEDSQLEVPPKKCHVEIDKSLFPSPNFRSTRKSMMSEVTEMHEKVDELRASTPKSFKNVLSELSAIRNVVELPPRVVRSSNEQHVLQDILRELRAIKLEVRETKETQRSQSVAIHEKIDKLKEEVDDKFENLNTLQNAIRSRFIGSWRIVELVIRNTIQKTHGFHVYSTNADGKLIETVYQGSSFVVTDESQMILKDDRFVHRFQEGGLSMVVERCIENGRLVVEKHTGRGQLVWRKVCVRMAQQRLHC